MKNKRTRLLIIVLCLLVAAIIALYYVFFSTKTISGNIEFSDNAIDDKFGVSVSSPILFRNVEMVQYYKNENGEVETVFANYQLDSFDEYINPVFPNDLTSEVFISNPTINGYIISKDSALGILNCQEGITQLKDLPVLNTSEYVISNDSYVTPSNDWEIGDIRISYSYIDTSKTFEINANVRKNEIQSIENIFVK